MKHLFDKQKASDAAKKRWALGTKHGDGRNPYILLWNSIKTNRSVKLKKIDFTITPDDIEALYKSQAGLCALSGYTMNLNRGTIYSISVDRLDNSLGYVIDNIRLVCKAVNIMRNTLSDLELVAFCKKIADKN